MRYKANVSFSGFETMAKNQVKEISDGAVLNELLRCGYVSPVSETPGKDKEISNAVKRDKPKRGKGGNKG